MSAPNLVQRIWGVFDPVLNILKGVTTSGEFPYYSILAGLQVVANFAAAREVLSTGNTAVIALGATTPADGSGGTYAYIPSDHTSGAWFIGTISGTVLNVASVFNGTLIVGQSVNRSDTGAAVGTITSFGTGSGGTGTYNLSAGASISTAQIMTADTPPNILVGFDGGRWYLSVPFTPALAASLVPSINLTYNLGAPSFQWLNVYAQNAVLSGNATVAGNLTVSGFLFSSLIPTLPNTYALGAPANSWSQLYLGPNGAPAFNAATGNIGYYMITPAETAAGVTPTNYAYAPGNVLRYGTNTTPGTTDMTTAFQAAASSNNEVTIPDGTYKISSVVSLQANTALIGANRATVIINGPSAAYGFQYLSPLTAAVQNTGIKVDGFTYNGFGCLQLNQQGNTAHYGSLASYPTDVFNTECYIVGPCIRNFIFNGTYSAAADTNADTNKWPTTNTTTRPAPRVNPTDLLAAGCGIFAVKCFDLYIDESCSFFTAGIAVMLDGCDVSNINIGRYQNNARNVHILSHDDFGFSTKVKNGDILANRRRGGIYIDSANATIIDKNFFECTLALNVNNSDPGGVFVASTSDTNTHLTNNRIEANRVGAAAGSPEIDLAPNFGVVISGNSMDFTGGLPGAQIQIDSVNYYNPANAVGMAGANSYLYHFGANSDTVPPPVWAINDVYTYALCPHGVVDTNNQRLFNLQNPKPLSFSGSATMPWKISGTTSRPCINTANQPLGIAFTSTPEDLDLCLRVRGTYVSGGGSLAISWGGVSVWNGTTSFSSTSLNEQDIYLRRPDAQQGTQPIIVEIADGTVEWESFQLIPVTFQRYTAAPGGGSSPPYGAGNTWRIGDTVYNNAVTASTTPGWICTTGGVGGTAVFTAMPVL